MSLGNFPVFGGVPVLTPPPVPVLTTAQQNINTVTVYFIKLGVPDDIAVVVANTLRSGSPGLGAVPFNTWTGA